MISANYSRRDFLKTLGLTAAWLMLPKFASAKAGDEPRKQKPNIIVILSDDMGFSDLGCYGGEIRTPNLDKLAANGLRFTQFYNTARCCPTRASLMSGLYPHQAGVGHMTQDLGYDGYRGELSKNCVTIGEVLKPAGYSTYMTGKWHLTKFVTQKDPKDNWPLQRGFDKFYGTILGAGSYYDPGTLTRDNSFITPDKEEYYYTDAISDNAVNYIAEHKTDNPFFMYVAYTAAHWPMHARPEDIQKYKGVYDKGWDATRQQRYKRLIEMGLIDGKWPLTDRDKNVPAWEKEKDKAWQARRMEVYAAMIDCMDQGIGRIVEELKRTGKLDNTLILFLQDNGGCAEDYGSKPNSAKQMASSKTPKMSVMEIQQDMQPKVTRDGRPVRTGHVRPGPADTYIAYGIGWANVSDTPFRLYKHWVHEGGISTPLIAHWPAGIKDKGQLRNQPGHLIDIMATCVEMAGAKYPSEFKGQKIKPMEGKSLLAVFDNKPLEQRNLFWEHEGNRAVRQGDWKLVAKGKAGPWELYNLADDRTETKNLAQDDPARSEQMAKLWDEWAQRANVLPMKPRRKKQ